MAFNTLYKLLGAQMPTGDSLNKNFAYPLVAYASGVTAKASGTVANSTPITETITQVDTVASSGDGVLLPYPNVGQTFVLINNGSNPMTVFVAGGGTLNGTAGATGVSQSNGKTAEYFCAKVGTWFRCLSA